MIIFNFDETNTIPNWLQEADNQEGHDYEADALQEIEANYIDD